VIADQSVNHVERIVIDEGHTARRTQHDYGYDLDVVTYDPDGYVEPGLFYIQIKASEQLKESGTNYVFDLDIRDYNLWMNELMPVVLILYDVSRRRAYWLDVQNYFRRDFGRRPRKNAKTVRVSVGKRQAFNGRAVATLREIVRRTLDLLKGAANHD
jgi:Domain of unknown function (DUF4365)